jgi:hypothetical protein
MARPAHRPRLRSTGSKAPTEKSVIERGGWTESKTTKAVLGIAARINHRIIRVISIPLLPSDIA